MPQAKFTLHALAASCLVLALGACTGPADDAVIEPSLTSPSPAVSSTPEATPASPPVAEVKFPSAPAREPVPLALGDVQGFGGYDSTDPNQGVQALALELWQSHLAGAKVEQCMRDAGYDWSLEVDEMLFSSGPMAEMLQHFGKDIDIEDTYDMPMIPALPNDDMLEQLGEAGASQALGVLYGDFREGQGYVSELYKESLPDPEDAAAWAAEMYLTLPRTTREGPQVFPFAGGCLGKAREAMPEFTVLPDEVSAAFQATFDVDPELPIMVQAREAFDACIRNVGIEFTVDPAQMEAIEVLDEETIEAASSECFRPHRDVESDLMALARDQFVRDHEDFLSARMQGYDAQFEELDSDAAFLSYIDDVEQRMLNAS